MDIAMMHRKFNLGIGFHPQLLEGPTMHARYDFLDEEMSELMLAIDAKDMPGIVDALVDIVVVAKGTAVMMGVQWGAHWGEVHRANMAKKRGAQPKRPHMPAALITPEGWVPPNHQLIIDRHKG